MTSKGSDGAVFQEFSLSAHTGMKFMKGSGIIRHLALLVSLTHMQFMKKVII